MTRSWRWWPAVFGVTAIVVVLGQPRAGDAWDWRDAPLNLRLGLAFDRESSTFTDIVGLSASGAYPYGSSVNPANDDFLRVPPNEFTVAGTGTGFYIPFASGASVTAAAGSVSGRLPRAGTVTLTYSATQSQDARTSQGDRLKLESQDITIGYSHRVMESLALGGEFKITDTSIKLGSAFMDFPLHTTTDSLAYDARAGVLYSPAKQWLLALMGGGGWSYGHTKGAVEIPEVFGGPAPISFHTFTRSVNLRAGLGWRPSDKFGTYVDWEYLRLWTDEDSVSVGRTFAGIEYLPIVPLALRVGASVDTAGKTNVSTGIGFYGLKHVAFEVAYVYNPFPEVRREFGPAQLFSASLVIVF